MSITVPQQQTTDEIQIIRTPPTVADAQLIVQMQTADALSGADRGHALLRSFETPPTLGQLRKKFAPGSDEYPATGLAEEKSPVTFIDAMFWPWRQHLRNSRKSAAIA